MRGAVFVIGLALASTSLASTGRAEPPAEEVSAPEAVEPVESSEARAARQEAARRAAGGHEGVWAISARIAREADEAARAVAVPLPEVTTWYRPPGHCAGCSTAHAQGGVTLSLDGVERESRLAFARELSRRLGRHHRVSVVEAQGRRELHTAFRGGRPDGRPFHLDRRLERDGIVVRPDVALPPPAALVFGD
ncbi:MAG: hypothetical protein EVA89_13805 [Sandaracinaceae bacterium]|nr:MAG: hypothetical protein EVA89_13805 [Sandaracinaceae bacterium]